MSLCARGPRGHAKLQGGTDVVVLVSKSRNVHPDVSGLFWRIWVRTWLKWSTRICAIYNHARPLKFKKHEVNQFNLVVIEFTDMLREESHVMSS